MSIFEVSLYDVLQTTIIAIILAMSILHVSRKLAPNWMYKHQAALADNLSLPSRSIVLRRLGKFIQPSATSGDGCGSGCNTCASCDSNPNKNQGNTAEPAADTRPLKFTRHI